MKDNADLSGLPVWERARIVFEQTATLKNGEAFEFKMELDPHALVSQLEELQPGKLAARTHRLGEREWRVTLTRVQNEEDPSPLSAAVRRNAVFSELGEAGRATLLGSMTERTARKGEIVRAEDSECSTLGLLLEGALIVCTGARSRENLLFHVFPGDIFGAIEFFDGGRAVGRTVAVSKIARYASVPFSVLAKLSAREPKVLLALGAANAQRSRDLAASMAAHVSQTAVARVASALLPYAAPGQGLGLALPPLAHMTQAHLAAAAGTVKEVAARAIAELERESALRRERGHVRYLDRAKLLEAIGSR